MKNPKKSLIKLNTKLRSLVKKSGLLLEKVISVLIISIFPSGAWNEVQFSIEDFSKQSLELNILQKSVQKREKYRTTQNHT